MQSVITDFVSVQREPPAFTQIDANAETFS